MSRTTILFFDIDSTLIENHFSRPAIGQLLGEIAAVSGKDVREHGRELWLENNRRQLTDPDNVTTMDWDDILRSIAARYAVTLSCDLLGLWNDHARPETIEVLDNAVQVVRQLKTNGRKLVIATKGLSQYQLPVLKAVGLLDLFDDILTPDYTGYLKTTPAYFRRYKEQHPHARFIQVGDHYYDDVICAKRNGFYSIMRAPIAELKMEDPFNRPLDLVKYRQQISTYPQEGTDILPDAVVLSLEEVPAIVEALEKLR